MGRFSHLHVRSGFSYGSGLATPAEVVEAAVEMEMEACALTDRDGLYGIPRFLAACEERSLSPIVGAEVSMEGGGHLVLLARSAAGYRSLCRLITSYRLASGGQGHRRKPSCPLPTVLEHGEGLVCLTGAIPFGYLPRLLLSGRRREAEGALWEMREVFGDGNLYVELTDDRTAGSRRRLRKISAFAAELGLPVVATNEVAYLRPRDHRLHEVLVAASNLSGLPGPGYRPTDQLWLKPPGMMGRLFGDRPEALKNAADVAQRCAGSVGLAGKVHMPAALLPEGVSAEGRLSRLVEAGAGKRYGKRIGKEVRRRLRRELSCIGDLGIAPYFLIAHEAAGIARARGVPVTGRGSAANSVVAYCLGLTQPEPLSNRLLFERFLHEGRKDPPDIDLDLDSEGRDGVREELMGRYGRYGAAVAATAGTMSLRGAVRVAARALGHAPEEVDRLSRHVPARFRDRERVYAGLEGWEEALAEPQMRGHPLREDSGRHRLLLELSAGLCGRLWQAGTHNGGVVFGNEQDHLSGLVPLEPSGKEGLVRCQFDKDDLEYAGLPKLDLLGLKMHTALRKAGELASARAPLGEKVDPYALPQGDGATYKLIRTGKNAGMFQLESPGQMHLSRLLKPRRFSDLVAQISLFRPGPVRGHLVTPYVRRRNGLEPYSVALPELDEILRPTYGVLMYQEQVLEVARAVAGFTLAEGDGIRRAMTRDRGPGAMAGLRGEFLERAAGRGVPEPEAEKVFGWMEGFAAYGFPKAHAASFAELSYASAYMRTHYPAEFFAAVLDSQPMGFYSPRTLVNEARRAGVEVLPPDLHLSGRGFTVEEGGQAIRVGLGYAKHLSKAAISSILAEREKRPFASVAELYSRTAVESDHLTSLVKGGFLDALAGGAARRSDLLGQVARLPKKPGHSRRGQEELPLPHPASWWEEREGVGRRTEYLPLTADRRERMEWEALGINVSRHPLSPYRRALGELGVVPSVEMLSLPHGTRTRAAGLLESLQRPPTKSGRTVYFLLIEDEAGLLQCTIFESAYRRCGHVLHHAGAFLIEGRVEQDRRRGFSFLVERVRDLYEVLDAGERAPEPRTVSSSGAFVRAGKGRGRKAM